MYDIKACSVRLAKFLKERRKELKITQEKLSEYSGIDYKHVQRLESPFKQNDLRLSTLLKLSEGLQISPVIFIERIIFPEDSFNKKSTEKVWLVGEKNKNNFN